MNGNSTNLNFLYRVRLDTVVIYKFQIHRRQKVPHRIRPENVSMLFLNEHISDRGAKGDS